MGTGGSPTVSAGGELGCRIVMVQEREKPRRYRLTPGRLLGPLLAVEGILWLSARFQWFALNQHKGWTVVAAIATVGVFVALMLVWFVLALVLGWRFQFSIASLLVLAVAVALPFSWLGTEMKGARTQREAVAAILEAGGDVVYDYQWDLSGTGEPPGPRVAARSAGGPVLCRRCDDATSPTPVSTTPGWSSLGGCTNSKNFTWATPRSVTRGSNTLRASLSSDFWSSAARKLPAGVEHFVQIRPNCQFGPFSPE